MQIKNAEAWAEGLKNNTDPYGAEVYRYAERWANLMEEQINGDGKQVGKVAKETSHKADTSGITGFMYGCAVLVLSHCWKFGEELRQWHNLDTQIGSEGEKANASGGVLNPAVLNIG